MVIATGKVHGASVELESGDLPDGARVTVLATEGDETFVLGPAEEAMLIAAMSEADAGLLTPAVDVLAQIRRP